MTASTPPSACPRSRKQSLRRSFGFAFAGLRYLLAAERNARIHLLATAIVVLVSVWLRLTPLEWALVLFVIGFVFFGEMANTAIELLVDLSTLEYNPLAKHAKDVAAGATLVAAMTAAATGILVLGPKLLSKLTSAH